MHRWPNVVDVANDLGNDHRKRVFGIKLNCLTNYALTYRLFPRFYLIAQIGAIVCTLIDRASCVFHLGLNAFWESQKWQRYSINLFQWEQTYDS